MADMSRDIKKGAHEKHERHETPRRGGPIIGGPIVGVLAFEWKFHDD
jgi:hypothetical protein